MVVDTNKTIGEMVADDFRAASVFSANKIDFCCKGNRTLDEVCNQKGLDVYDVLAQLEKATESNNSTIDFNTWELDLLIDYIEKKHHRYVEEKTQEIKPYLEKICRVHGGRHPELLEINEHFNATAGELAMHMKKEELMVFPFIKKMVKAKEEGTKVAAPNFESIQFPIQAMMDEHTNEGDRFRLIEALSDNYTPPADGCNTYRVTFALLKEFEQDLHLHIHLENNILFPKAIELEKELFS